MQSRRLKQNRNSSSLHNSMGRRCRVTTTDMNSFLIATSQRSILQTRQFRLVSYRACLPRPQAKSNAMPAFGTDSSAKSRNLKIKTGLALPGRMALLAP